MRIGELGAATGTKVETIRFYEKIGLLVPAGRTSGNYRTYGPEHLRHLSFIRGARALGFDLDQVRELIDLDEDRTSSPREIAATAGRHRELADQKLSALRSLWCMLDRCAGNPALGSGLNHGIIDALGPDGETQESG